MRKILLTILILAISASTCFAGAVVMKSIQVMPDVMIADIAGQGTIYNGKPGILKDSTIALNRNYINAVIAYVSSNSVQVRFSLGNFVYPDYCPNLPDAFQGKIGWVAYKSLSDQASIWVKKPGFPVDAPAIFEQTGVLINPSNFYSKYGSSARFIDKNNGTCGLNGMYPQWRFQLDILMTKADYDNKFKPAVKAWSGANLFQEVLLPTPSPDGTR